MTLLENEYLRIGIAAKGAEWVSLYDKTRRCELLWEADPQFWGRHSCILFPIIGKLKENSYRLDDQQYTMPQHGCVRDEEFTLVEQRQDRVVFQFRANPATMSVYPFDFELKVIYTLQGSSLSIQYEVYNHSGGTMPFSIGAHPGFTCPLYSGERRSDYRLVFDQVETASAMMLDANGLITDEKRLILDQASTLVLEDGIFDDDALIFEDLKSSSVSLVNAHNQQIWTFDFSEFSHLGIWSARGDAPYVCIEPWLGHADIVDTDQNFRTKKSALSLAPKAAHQCTHRVIVHQG